MNESGPQGVRLQKVLAQAGVASRRAAEDLIFRGRVEVNGVIVSERGLRVDPAKDVIRVDGARIPPQRAQRYLVLNKPRGVVCTMSDPQGRPTVADSLGSYAGEGLFHVGRLDTDTWGLLLLTNDGDFAQRMTHPSHEVAKTYLAEVEGSVRDQTLAKLRKGVQLDDGPVRPDQLKLIQREPARTLIQVELHEGRNRIVRRMFDAVGHPVRELSRTAIGPVALGRLKVGELRELTREELGALLDLVGL